MTAVKNLKELEKILNKKISKALQQSVAPVVKNVMKEKIEEEVYDVYSPTIYERQKDNGGLTDDENIKTTLMNNTILAVENVRSDDGVNVAQVVETGQGYDYDFPHNGVPRPFTEATREHLRDTNEHVAALYKGLVRQGLNVRVK
ncbi:MAG: hypothetical protein ACQEXX_01935 [Bacillota bacterium]